MNDGFDRNRVGKIIGWIKLAPRRADKLAALYDESDNRTRNREGCIVGGGAQRLRSLGKGERPE
jgi:hypothetical protein